jgi:nucleoid-associated protein YgaU
MRYQFTPTEKRWDGKNVYRTTYYPIIPESYDDFYITVSESDYLDSLAKKYYGDETLWWIIARANNLPGYKLSVTTNRQLRIPGNISVIMNRLKQLN